MNVGTLLIGHGHWRWLLLAVVGIAFARNALGAATGGSWSAREGYLMVAARIAAYVQIFLGLALAGMLGAAIDGKALVPHLVAALAGVAALEIGAARSKRAEGDAAKFKIAAIGSGAALALFLVTAFVTR